MSKIQRRFMVLSVVAILSVVAVGCATDDATLPTDPANSPAVAGSCLVGTPDCNDTPDDLDREPTDGPINGGYGMSVTQALSEDGSVPIAVTGFFIADGSGAWLCESVAESYPPQCGGERLSVTNPDALGALVLIEEGDTQWYEGSLTMMGTVSDGTFTILTDSDG